MLWGVVFVAVFSQLCHYGRSSLVSSPTVACPNDRITFTCTLPGDTVNWIITPVMGNSVSQFVTIVDVVLDVGTPNFMFEAFLVNRSGDNATAILTSVTDVRLLEGARVQCQSIDGLTRGPLTISVADQPSVPRNPRTRLPERVMINSSTLTLEWDTPSTLGGVSVQYILSFSPTPLFESPVMNTSAQITVSYNTLYNVTIRAENCAGPSGNVTTTIEILACPWPLTPASGVMITSPPSAPVVDSTLTFSCYGQSVVSTCDSQGRWFEDPENYVCTTHTTVPPVTCAPPSPPVNGSTVGSVSDSSPVGTVINYRCNSGLFPSGDLSSTCSSDGMWNPNPQSQLCSPEPCMTPVLLSSGAAVGITFVVTAVVFTIFAFLAGVAVIYLFTRKKAVYSPTEGQANIQPTVPAGPVYEDVLPAPKEEIELKTNDAYGPVRQ